MTKLICLSHSLCNTSYPSHLEVQLTLCPGECCWLFCDWIGGSSAFLLQQRDKRTNWSKVERLCAQEYLKLWVKDSGSIDDISIQTHSHLRLPLFIYPAWMSLEISRKALFDTKKMIHDMINIVQYPSLHTRSGCLDLPSQASGFFFFLSYFSKKWFIRSVIS